MGINSPNHLEQIKMLPVEPKSRGNVLSEMTNNTPGIFIPRNRDLKHVSGPTVPLYILVAKGTAK